ncbi:MAG TPA: nucleotide disphospho-sugar-binding domain-containing protein [Solirubrobacterales bacterium]|nr:nucleotide disphospho-sugar-binding domain-containing protein [Solirubrobacterales bacterium]
MARIMLYTSPSPGHIYPPMATILALRERGHEVAIRTSAPKVGMLSQLGLEAAPIDPRIDAIEVEDWKARTSIGAIRMLLEAWDARAGHEVADLQNAIAEEQPDLLWIDPIATGAAGVAAASGIPWSMYIPYPWPGPAPGVPAFGPGFAPSDSALGRARDGATEQVKKLAYRSAVSRLNARRSSLGLPALDRYEDLYLTADLVIEFSAEPFEYPREWAPNIRLVGPALWEPPASEPEWLASEERPIVLATASTEFQDDAAVIRCALEALADSPYLVVATTAAHDSSDFDPPANARVESFLPHGPILRRAAAVISHGGMGTTQKALAAGVPVCVVPFMRDQFEVARRAEHCGGGTMLPARRLRPDRLRAAVEAAIERRAGAERVRDAFEQAGGADAAASALEGLVTAAGQSAWPPAEGPRTVFRDKEPLDRSQPREAAGPTAVFASPEQELGTEDSPTDPTLF